MSASGAFTVAGVDTHSLAVDTSNGNLYAKGSVSDPYIGVYAFDTIHVLWGARAVTEGLVFYREIDIQDGSFTSFTGTQTWTIKIDSINKIASINYFRGAIGENDTTYQGYSMQLNNCNMNILGDHHFKNIVTSGSGENRFTGNMSFDTVIIGPGTSAYFEGNFQMGKFTASYNSFARVTGTATVSGDLVDSGYCELINGPFDVGGNVLIENAYTFRLGGQLHVGKDVSITNSTVYGQRADTVNVFPFIMNVDGNFTMNSWCYIHVSGCGYPGARYVNGSWHGARTFNNETLPMDVGGVAGGSYGGLGGVSGAGAPVKCYGDFYNPNEFGTGGGATTFDTYNSGGNGGGLVRITAKNMTLNGCILADGEYPTIGAGGSGGSIYLSALDTIRGYAYLYACGYPSNGYGNENANGGGGRIAMYAKRINDGIYAYAYGCGGPNLAAGAGTIFIRDSIRPLGNLTIFGGDQETAPNSTPLPAIGESHITAMSADTLYDTTKVFSPFVKGHLVKLNYDLVSSSGAFTVTGVDTHGLLVDTSNGNLYAKGSVGDPYIGVYAFDTIVVKGGARVQTSGLVFYNVIQLNNGWFTSFTGTQTGMMEKKGDVPEDIRVATVSRKVLRQSIPVIDNNYIRTATVKSKRGNESLLITGPKVEKKSGMLTRIKDFFKKLFAGVESNKGEKQPVSLMTKQVDTGVSLLMRKNEAIPVQLASTGMTDFQKNVDGKKVLADQKAIVVAQNIKAEKPVCRNGDPAYSYDVLNRIKSMTTPVGTTTYHYDSLTGRLDKITSPEGKEFSYQYNRGQLESMQMPNGITANYSFDEKGNLTLLDYKKSGSTIRSYAYTYDKNDMRTSMTDVDGLHSYVYDSLYQIVQATHPSVQNPLEQFTYDAAGNRLTDLTHSAFQYNELNQLLEDDSCVYQYDLDGNMTEKVDKATGDTTVFTYDIENKLVQVQKQKAAMVAQYSYDAIGRRMKKDVNGEVKQYRYDNENIILEMNGNDSIVVDYTFEKGIDNPLMMRRNGSNYYYVRDGLGSVTALTDETGDVKKGYSYEVFGRIIEESGDTAIENSFTYTSRERDKETGIYYYRARFYYPGNGRFTQQDPAGYSAGLNLYRYVSNSPVSLIDPLGLYDIEVHYTLTYFWARLAKVNPDCALQIAECDQGVDERWYTNPNYILPAPIHFQNPTIFPGIAKEWRMGDIFSEAAGAAKSCDTDRFGFLLHLFQDSFSHMGIGPVEHFINPSVDIYNPSSGRDKMMKRFTETLLKIFARSNCKCCKQ